MAASLRIFTVKVEAKWSGSKGWDREDPLQVVAPDAEVALAKAKKHLLAVPPIMLDDGSKTKITAVRLLGVELVAEADL